MAVVESRAFWLSTPFPEWPLLQTKASLRTTPYLYLVYRVLVVCTCTLFTVPKVRIGSHPFLSSNHFGPVLLSLVLSELKNKLQCFWW